MLARENRLTSSDEIRQVIRSGKRSSNKFATIHFVPAVTSQFAVVTSRAVGNAVARNLLRRRTKGYLFELLTKNPPVKAVIRYRAGAAELSYQELTRGLSELLSRTDR